MIKRNKRKYCLRMNQEMNGETKEISDWTWTQVLMINWLNELMTYWIIIKKRLDKQKGFFLNEGTYQKYNKAKNIYTRIRKKIIITLIITIIVIVIIIIKINIKK
jgi:hypothetical protein